MPLAISTIDKLLDLLFNNADFGGIGDSGGLRGSVASGQWWLSLHSSEPALIGDQTSFEIVYGGYARAPVNRTGAGWTRTGTNVSPVANVQWPVCTGGAALAVFVGIGTAPSGGGILIGWGPAVPPIAISVGIRPEAVNNSLITFA